MQQFKVAQSEYLVDLTIYLAPSSRSVDEPSRIRSVNELTADDKPVMGGIVQVHRVTFDVWDINADWVCPPASAKFEAEGEVVSSDGFDRMCIYRIPGTNMGMAFWFEEGARLPDPAATADGNAVIAFAQQALPVILADIQNGSLERH